MQVNRLLGTDMQQQKAAARRVLYAGQRQRYAALIEMEIENEQTN